MPSETQQAVDWALQQTYTDDLGFEYPITKDTPQELVDKVREYFNDHDIAYESFSYLDLLPYLPE